MNSKIALGIGVVVGLAAGYFLFGAGDKLARAEAELAELRAATNSLGTELANLQGAQVDGAELDRLRADQREAIRLRGELTSLKQQVSNAVASAQSAQRAASQAQARANAQGKNAAALEGIVEPRSFTSQTVVAMAPGQTVVMGGWPTGTGTVTYAFLTPTVGQQGDNTVLVSGKFVEMTEEVAARIRTMHGAGGGQGGLTLNPETMNMLQAQWAQTPGVKIISSPRIQTTSGVQGSMSVGAMMPTANGQVHFGQEVSVTPTLAADGSQIQLNVDARMTVPAQGNPQ